MRTTAFLAGLVLFLGPAMARADEPTDKAHCSGAVQTQDWSAVTVSCRALADDYALDAQRDGGQQHALDLMLEGIAMSDVGMAYDNIESYAHAASAKTAARFFLSDAQTQTDDPKLLTLIENALSRL